MEHIQKALEKAGQQRQKKSAKTQEVPKPVAARSNSLKAEEITYTHTSHIPVSEQLLKQKRVIAGLEDDKRADIFKILRTKILHRMRTNDWNVIAVCSPISGSGKSLVASNLAISIAMDAKHSVLLVDLDLRNPGLHEYFNLPAETGVREYLEGQKSIPELLIHPEIPSLVVLPAGKALRHSSDLLSSLKMHELAAELKNRYTDRIVVIDLPPLLQTDDALVILPQVDACVMVVAEGENSEEEVKNSISLIDPEKYLGCILNKSADDSMPNYY